MHLKIFNMHVPTSMYTEDAWNKTDILHTVFLKGQNKIRQVASRKGEN